MVILFYKIQYTKIWNQKAMTSIVAFILLAPNIRVAVT